MMHCVYSNAIRVQIWLGLGDETLMADAFDLLKKCANPLNDDSDGLKTFKDMGGALEFEQSEEWCARMESLLPDLDTQHKILEAVFGRPWFERLWAAQEVWLGRDHIVLAGVHLSMCYEIICRGAFLVTKGQANITQFSIPGVTKLLHLVEARCQRDQLDLSNFLHFEEWKASEEKDLVYALLAITDITPSVRQYSVIDYNKPVLEVYMDATRGMVEATKVLSILYCETSSVLNYPSWSPNWGPDASPHFWWTSAFNMLFDRKFIIGAHTRPDELRVKGRCFQTVDSVCGVYMDDCLSPEETSHRIMQWYALSQAWYMRSRSKPSRLITSNSSRYRLRNSRKFDELFATIISGGLLFQPRNFSETFDTKVEDLALPYFHNYFFNWAIGISSDLSIDPEIRLLAPTLTDTKTGILARVTSTEYGKEFVQDTTSVEFYRPWLTWATIESSFFHTSDGLLGMGRGDIKAGDQSCALYGGAMPFVLRQDETGDYWRVIGTAFVDPARFNEPAYWETGKEQWFSLI